MTNVSNELVLKQYNQVLENDENLNQLSKLELIKILEICQQKIIDLRKNIIYSKDNIFISVREHELYPIRLQQNLSKNELLEKIIKEKIESKAIAVNNSENLKGNPKKMIWLKEKSLLIYLIDRLQQDGFIKEYSNVWIENNFVDKDGNKIKNAKTVKGDYNKNNQGVPKNYIQIDEKISEIKTLGEKNK